MLCSYVEIFGGIMECNYKIYMHKNKINSKVYIGQTCRDLNKRFGSNGSGYVCCPLFYKAIQKYGWDNFEHIILEDNIQTLEEANDKERYYISLYNSTNHDFGYNIQIGGNDTSYMGIEVHQYSLSGKYICSYMSVSKAEKENNIANGKISACCLGKRKSAGGFMWSYEKYDNIAPYSTNGHSITVYCYDFNGDYVGEYPSAVEAAKKLGGINGAHIAACCNGKRKYAFGYQWKKYKVDKIPSITPLKTNEPIFKMSLSGKILCEYNNTMSAAKEFQDVYAAYFNIRNCLEHVSKTAYEYIWIYQKEYKDFDIKKYDRIHCGKAKSVKQYTKEGKYLRTFNSRTEAANFVNGNISAISNCASGKTKTAYGYVWKNI